jgi:hypothetical protein
MTTQNSLTRSLVISAVALACSVSTPAQVSRTFVATTGSDSNVSANCSATAPCRTFNIALTVTSSGGEIVVLNSGGYGQAAINQPVTITAIGVAASISVASGDNGLTIDTPGNVTLIGLNLHGEGAGSNGIQATKVGFLRLYNMLVENFTNSAVNCSKCNVAIYNSAFNDNGGYAVNVEASPGYLYVENSHFENNGNSMFGGGGLEVIATHATVTGSSFVFNDAGIELATGTATFTNSVLSNNTGAIFVTGEGVAYIAGCLLASNGTAYDLGAGTGSLVGTSPGTNLITPGQATTGTLSSPVTLQ